MILNRLNIFRRHKDGDAPEVKTPLPKSIVQQVLEAPALFNRATRRSIKLWGSIWRWDLNASAETRRTYLPRYIRRHYNPKPPTTRRERRHLTHIMRLTRAKGLMR